MCEAVISKNSTCIFSLNVMNECLLDLTSLLSIFALFTLIERVFSKRYKVSCVPIKDSDQTAHLRSLIRVFDERSGERCHPKFLQAENKNSDQTVGMCRLI